MNPHPVPPPASEPGGPVHRRRPRYPGKHPRRFEHKYKELNPGRYADTVAKVLASGKTPAGTHRPIMVSEVLVALNPKPGESAIDCTLGYGGHARDILPRLLPGGRLLGLDADPLELPKTEARLRELGFGPEAFTALRTNFAALPQALASVGWSAADLILADLGVSSMQLDDPARGFSTKVAGPLDMRLNPHRGVPASVWLEKASANQLAQVLLEHADEPQAQALGAALAGRSFATTMALSAAVRSALPRVRGEELDLSIRRVFQAIRVAVNDEFSVLESLLRSLPACLNPGGRAAILTFHSGEDRRVKHAFQAGLQAGLYSMVSEEVTRASAEERQGNPRSIAAKLRWAVRAGSG